MLLAVLSDFGGLHHEICLLPWPVQLALQVDWLHFICYLPVKFLAGWEIGAG